MSYTTGDSAIVQKMPLYSTLPAQCKNAGQVNIELLQKAPEISQVSNLFTLSEQDGTFAVFTKDPSLAGQYTLQFKATNSIDNSLVNDKVEFTLTVYCKA